MSDETIKQYVDFAVGSDTGQDEAASILPFSDGEDANATVFRRPSEILRLRTEALRSVLEDVLHLRDADRSLLIGGPGKVTWPGSTTAGQNGTPVLSDTLWLLPALTPGYAQTAPVPPVSSRYGTLTLNRVGALAGITITSALRSYQGGDRINVTVVLTTGSLAVTVLEDDLSIIVTAPTSATLTAVINAINTAMVSLGTVAASLAAGATGTDLIVSPQNKQFVVGNFDGEGHTITPAALATFFGTSGNRLAEGDTLCIQYDKLIASGNGGRRQSIPENTNTTIPSGSFFNSRVNPERLTNAIPLCKVINGRLVFLTGQTVPVGAVTWDLGDATANIAADPAPSYLGGGNWADATTNPGPVTVEAQLDKIIVDLTSTTADAGGAAKIGIGARTYPGAGALSASDLAARLLAMDTAYDGRFDAHTSSIATNTSDIAARALTTTVDAALALKLDKAGGTMTGLLTANLGVTIPEGQTLTMGTDRIKHGLAPRSISPFSYYAANTSWTKPTGAGSPTYWVSTVITNTLIIPINDTIPGKRLMQVDFACRWTDGTDPPTFRIWYQDITGTTAAFGFEWSPAVVNAGTLNLSHTGIALTYAANTSYYIVYVSAGSGTYANHRLGMAMIYEDSP